MSAAVTVRGTAVVNIAPDEVTLALTVSYLDRTPESALAEVGRRSAALDALLDEMGIESRQRTTTGATVRERAEWDAESKRQIHRGYAAANEVRLRLSDPEPVGRLMSEAVARAHAEISGPDWSIALDNPARLEACRLAALNARARAEAYVAALGARLGAIVSVAEPEASVEPIPRRGAVAYAMAARDSAPPVEVSAGELEIRAVVDISWAIEQG